MAQNMLSFMLDELEQIVLDIISGAALSSTPLPTLDPAHPIVTAAANAAVIGGKTIAAAFPGAGALAAMALPIAQGVVNYLAPAPTAASKR